MKAVILAAGMGIRMQDELQPKCLIRLKNGETILDRQLNTLKKYLSIHDIMIVVGHLKEQIMQSFPDLLYVYNPDFQHENTSKSLLRALYKVDEDLLWLNGDVVYHPNVLEKVFSHLHTSMVVNRCEVGEEEVKYRYSPAGLITEVSKTVHSAQGEALGINFFSKKDIGILQEKLEACSPKDYFEKAIEESIKENVHVIPVFVEKDDCTEVDFINDLQHANALLSQWT